MNAYQNLLHQRKLAHDKFRTSKRWLDFRLNFIARHANTCEFCGKKYTKTACLNVHHKYYCTTQEEYENLEESRFMLLCRECHTFIHKKANAPKIVALNIVNVK